MPFGDPLDDASGSLRDFEDALKAATDALGDIGGVGAGGGGAGGGQGGGGAGGPGGGAGSKKSTFERLAVGGAKAGLLASLVVSSNEMGAGLANLGSAEAGGGMAMRGMLGLGAKVPFLGGITGMTRADKVLGRSEGRVGGFLGDAAAQGMDITDEQIQSHLDVAIGQEKRRADVEDRVKAISGKSENMGAATPDALGSLLKLVEKIEASISGLTGGAGR